MPKPDGGRFYLIPTAEVPVTNMVRDELLNVESLPLGSSVTRHVFAPRRAPTDAIREA